MKSCSASAAALMTAPVSAARRIARPSVPGRLVVAHSAPHPANRRTFCTASTAVATEYRNVNAFASPCRTPSAVAPKRNGASVAMASTTTYASRAARTPTAWRG